jgi:hypothetical protein
MKTITRLVLTFAVVAVITITPEARQALSIDTLMATPFPTDLVAAPAVARLRGYRATAACTTS